MHRVAPTESNDCNRIFMRKKTKRSTPVTATELEIRNRFAAIARAVQQRSQDLSKIATDIASFRAQRDQPGGKRTIKAYLWKLELNKYDSEHNG